MMAIEPILHELFEARADEVAEFTAGAAQDAVEIFEADPKSKLFSDRAKLQKVAQIAADLCFGIRPITEEGEA